MTPDDIAQAIRELMKRNDLNAEAVSDATRQLASQGEGIHSTAQQIRNAGNGLALTDAARIITILEALGIKWTMPVIPRGKGSSSLSGDTAAG